jgi:hypothetical protein
MIKSMSMLCFSFRFLHDLQVFDGLPIALSLVRGYMAHLGGLGCISALRL